MRRLLLATGALLVAAAPVVASRWERWHLDALAPDAPFDARAAPRPPDYSDPATWTALYQLHSLNLRRNAEERVAAHLRAGASGRAANARGARALLARGIP